jgi:hypothetical protein
MNWDKPLKFFQKYGFTQKFVSDMYDGMSSLFANEPRFDLFKFDDYIHHWKGNYEEQRKSLSDMFNEIFGEDVETAKMYFGLT